MKDSEYTCPICGEVFNSIDAFAKHFSQCNAERVEANRKAEKERKESERAARKEEVDAAFAKANKLRDAFLRDYGVYAYGNNKVKSIWDVLSELGF